MAHDTTIPHGSVEYLYADIRADRVLNTQAVSLSFTTTQTPGSWTDAEWVGRPAAARSARLLLDGTLPRATYNVFARVSDYPEAPILRVGRLKIV